MRGVVYRAYASLGNKGQRTLPAPLKLASRWRELMSASTPAKTSSLGVSCPTAGLGHDLHTLRALSDLSNLRFPYPLMLSQGWAFADPEAKSDPKSCWS